MAVVDGKVVFDETEQKEVDRIIQERLSRVKAEKPADYDDLQELAKAIEDFEYKGTPKEKAAALKEFKAQQKEKQRLAEIEEQAEKEGTSPELLKRIADAEKKAQEAKDELAEIKKSDSDKKAASEASKIQEANYQLARAELLEKHEVDADDLEKNPRFMKFVKGKSGINLVEEYEDFLEFIGETEKEAIIKVKSKEERSTSGGQGGNQGGGHGLSQDEKDLVDDHNARYPKQKMTYKEFAQSKNR